MNQRCYRWLNRGKIGLLASTLTLSAAIVGCDLEGGGGSSSPGTIPPGAGGGTAPTFDAVLSILTANRGDETITTLVGTGGSFGTANSSATGGPGQMYDMATADINGDGNLDVVAPNDTDRTVAAGGAPKDSVSVLLGDGDGNFSAVTGSPFLLTGVTEPDPEGIAIGDVDNDNNLDIVTANEVGSQGSISVLLGNGSGGFTQPPLSPFGGNLSNPHAVALGDMDGDGNLDAVTASYGSSSDVAVLLGDGTGAFTEVTGSPFTAGNDAYDVELVDLNGDGDLDAVVADRGGNAVLVMEGDGAGQLGAPTSTAVGTGPVRLAIGDMNRDTNIDVIVANADSDSVSVLLGDGAGNLAPSQNSPFTVGNDPNGIDVGDLDGDGNLDVATANYGGSDDVTVLLGNGSGGFNSTEFTFSVGDGPFSLEIDKLK